MTRLRPASTVTRREEAVRLCSLWSGVVLWQGLPGSRLGAAQAPKADRRPGAAKQVEDSQIFEGGDKCTICLEYIHPDDDMNLTLPCKHTLHGLCVASLRNKAVAQLCPTCRAALPLGPQDLFEKARDNYQSIKSKVERGSASWGSLSNVAAKKMSDAIQMLKEASAQGHAGAQLYLGSMYANGRGVK